MANTLPTGPSDESFIDSSGNTWTGVDKNGNGRGTVTRKDGTIDEGQFVDGNLSEGERTSKDGTKYKGKFYENNLSEGRVTHNDGNFTDVKMSRGHMFDGTGERVYSNGWKEAGDFVKGGIKKGIVTRPDGATFDGEHDNDKLFNGVVTLPDGRQMKIVNGIEEASADSIDYTLPREFTDDQGYTWSGIFDADFTGEGNVENRGGQYMARGTFIKRKLNGQGGKRRMDSGTLDYDESGSFDEDELHGYGIRQVGPNYRDGEATYNGYFMHGKFYNGAATYKNGMVVNFEDGQKEPIKSITENAHSEISKKDYEKNKAAIEKGIARLIALIDALPEEIDRRRIGKLVISYKFMKPDGPGWIARRIGKKAPEKDDPWSAIEVNPHDTHVDIDPLHLPTDDKVITSELIKLSKHYEYQRKAEGLINRLQIELGINFELDYEHGFPMFKASIAKIDRIRNILERLAQEERDSLSTAGTVLLLSGQKPEDYKDSEYNIILSCDSPLSDDGILGEIRGKLNDLDNRRVAMRASSGKPNRTSGSRNKPSTGGIFSSTRSRVAAAIASLAIAGSGVAIHHVMTKPAPVAPKPPDKPKDKPVEPPKPSKEAEATKPPPKPEVPPEAAPVEKVDLSKIPLDGKVSFTTREEGVAKGVLFKNTRGKYQAVDKFDFDPEDPKNLTVVRIEE